MTATEAHESVTPDPMIPFCRKPDGGALMFLFVGFMVGWLVSWVIRTGKPGA